MSSDSEDDFYDNITERLQKEKDKFQEDRIETANLLDDSHELDEIVKNYKIPPKNARKSTKKSTEATAGSSVSDLPDITVDNTQNPTPKRMTRSRAKNSKTEVIPDLELPTSRSKRQKNNPPADATRDATVNDTSTGENSQNAPSTSRGRGRGRGKARGRGRGSPRARGRSRGRGRRSWGCWLSRDGDNSIFSDLMALMAPHRHRNNTLDPSVPTYNIGNTHDYPDQSQEQPLFSSSNTKKTEDVVMLEENLDEDNEELSVKVYWQSSEIFKFTIRRFQKLTQIFDYFAKKENVTHDKLLFTFNDRILCPEDTPDVIDYSIVKFIDGGIITKSVADLLMKANENIKGGIKVKFQCQNVKKPYEITVRPDDKLAYAMLRCSEHLEKPLEKLEFDFDGDRITGKLTARELEFEGGECIDVRILS